MFKAIFLLIFIIFLATTCKISQKSKTKASATTVITFKKVKGRCMRCPHFSIDILDNQTAIYDGKANVAVLGKREIDLSTKQYKTLIKQFEESNFTSFEPLYLTRRRDSPRWILSYNGHKVNTQEPACPESLMKLMQLVESIKPK